MAFTVMGTGNDLSVLPFIEAGERNQVAQRLLCQGESMLLEIWIESGSIVHWESTQESPLEQQLQVRFNNIWVRPLAVDLNKPKKMKLKLCDILQQIGEDNPGEQEVHANSAPKAKKPAKKASKKTTNIAKLGATASNALNGIDKSAHRETSSFSAKLIGKGDLKAKTASKEEYNIIVFEKKSKNRFVLGRSSSCDIIIESLGASRKHCELFFDGKLIHVKDLNSTNGTRLNNEKIYLAIAENKDVLQIEDLSFELKIE